MISVGRIPLVGDFVAGGVVGCRTLIFLEHGSRGWAFREAVGKDVKSISGCAGEGACDGTEIGRGSQLVVCMTLEGWSLRVSFALLM